MRKDYTIKTLMDAGLTQDQAAFYIASLELGGAGIGSITKRSGVAPGSAHALFKKLESMGLMEHYKMNKTSVYAATSPRRIQELVARRTESINAIMPELEALRRTNPEQSRVMFYTNPDDFMPALMDSLSTPNIMIRNMGMMSIDHGAIKGGTNYVVNHYVPERVRKNIKLRGLYFDPLPAKIQNADHAAILREIKILPKKYEAPISKMIYGDTVIISTSRKNFLVVVIESAQIAEAEKKSFDMIWDFIPDNKIL